MTKELKNTEEAADRYDGVPTTYGPDFNGVVHAVSERGSCEPMPAAAQADYEQRILSERKAPGKAISARNRRALLDERSRLREERDDAIATAKLIGDQHRKQMEHDGALIDRLREVERKAKEVIRPFAENACGGDGNGFLDVPNEHAARFHDLSNPTSPTLLEGHFRAARDLYRALSEREGQDG